MGFNFTDFFEFHPSTRISYRPGLVRDLAYELQRLPHQPRRVLVVTDAGIVRAGLLARIEAALAHSAVSIVSIFDAVPPNSSVQVVEAGAAVAQAAACDLVLAVGGGSVMDSAKCINILLSNGGRMLDHQGVNILARPLGPLVAIPTTAGTGSEVTSYAVIKDDQQQLKVIFASPYLKPDCALLDPELTVSLPAHITAASGIDALTHCIEAYVAEQHAPFSDALALHALELIANNLHSAVHTGSSLEARAAMLIASTMAGLAFDHAHLGACHALAHACGGRCNVVHGIANAILLPSVMRFNMQLDEVASRYANLARPLAISETGITSEQQAEAVIAQIERLRASVGVPGQLSQVGVRAADLALLADDALGDASLFSNPRLADADDLAGILQAAF